MKSNRQVTAAAAAAATIILAGGGYYRVLADRYARQTSSVTMPAGWLDALPLEIDGWTGEDDAMEESIIEATDTDAHLNRVYINDSRTAAVSMFLGYGIQLRDLAPHRPEVCYPGNGWLVGGTTDEEVTLADGSVLACRILNFHRGGFSSDAVTVLNFYIVDGRYCPDVSCLRDKATKVDAGPSYAVQVQLSSPGGLGKEPERILREFAAVCTPYLRALMPDQHDAASDADSVEAGSTP